MVLFKFCPALLAGSAAMLMAASLLQASGEFCRGAARNQQLRAVDPVPAGTFAPVLARSVGR